MIDDDDEAEGRRAKALTDLQDTRSDLKVCGGWVVGVENDFNVQPL